MEPSIRAYVAMWRTTQSRWGSCRLESNRAYRIYAFVTPPRSVGPSFLAGYADAWLVSRAQDLPSVDPTRYVGGGVNGQALCIRFRIDSGMVGGVSVQPDVATLAVGQQLQLTAAAFDIHGAPLPDAVAWASSSVASVVVSASGLVTGVAPGSAFVFGKSGPRLDSLQVTVLSSAPEAPPALLLPTSGVRVLQDNPVTQ